MSDVSILTLTKNGADSIGALLQGVFSQREASPGEVIVVDSGSLDATLQIAGQFPVGIERIPPGNLHHARTRNLAAGLASGGVLVFLSQDAVPASDGWLQALLENFAEPKVGAVYGRQIPKAGCSAERQDVLDTIIYGEHGIVKDPSTGNQIGCRFYRFSDVNAALRRSALADYTVSGRSESVRGSGHREAYSRCRLEDGIRAAGLRFSFASALSHGAVQEIFRFRIYFKISKNLGFARKLLRRCSPDAGKCSTAS